MDLYGWDTIYAITSTRINEVLLERGDELIIDFDQPMTEELPVSASGKFDRWEIVEGGSGSIVYLKLHIGEGTATLDLGEERMVDLAGGHLIASMELRLLPNTKSESEDLVFHIEGVGEEAKRNEPGMISPVHFELPDEELSSLESISLTYALLEYIVDNAEQISFVFANINLVPPETNSWLTPVHSGFVYADRIGNEGMFGILSVVSDKDIEKLPLEIPPELLETTYEAAYGISQELFLSEVIMPELPVVFGNGASLSDFEYSEGNRGIVNVGNIKLDPVKEGLITYHPELTRLIMTTNSEGLDSNMDGRCDLQLGIWMYFATRHRNACKFHASDLSIEFLRDNDASWADHADIPWYLSLVTLGIVDVVVSFIKDGIANDLAKDLSDKVSLARHPPTSIQWRGTSDLDVKDAGVNIGFYMEGNL